MSILKAENISRQFIRVRAGSNVFYAVKNAELALEPGVMVVLSGHSGSGKSTLLNMLSGLLEPTDGKVTLDGEDIYALGDAELSLLRNRRIGMIPQGQSAIQSLNVLENVLLPYTLYNKEDGGEAYKAVRARAVSLMEMAGIADLADIKPRELSGGELRRMAICRALINDPEFILADEPTGDLDDENTKIVLELLKSKTEEGRAVMIVTHDKDVLEYADKKYRMDGGTVKEMGEQNGSDSKTE